tara:strand:+ start:1073 stop:1333 length:261 start_codon:yes stop_codon:yes gene_type:complete
MDINELNAIVKKKISNKISVENIKIEDKSFLHENHKNHQKGKYHLKIIIESKDLKKLTKIDSTKKIYNILNEEMKSFIHSIQILIT